MLSNATQNVLARVSTIWACQAGKHVYCEKPVSHYIWEGRQMVNAARKYDRLVQTGTSSGRARHAEAIAWLQAGNLGRVHCVTCFANKPRKSGASGDAAADPGLRGFRPVVWPGRKRPIYRDHLQYDCSFDFHTGGGEYCNQGVHELDVAQRWLLGEKDMPRRVISLGQPLTFNDAADAPNTQIVCRIRLRPAGALRGPQTLRPPVGRRGPPFPRTPGGRGRRLRRRLAGHSPQQVRPGPGSERPIDSSPGRATRPISRPYINAVRSGRSRTLPAKSMKGTCRRVLCDVEHPYRLNRDGVAAAPSSKFRPMPRCTGGFSSIWPPTRSIRHRDAGAVAEVSTPRGMSSRDNPAANKLVRGSYRKPFVVPEMLNPRGRQSPASGRSRSRRTSTPAAGRFPGGALRNSRHTNTPQQAATRVAPWPRP